MKPEKYTRKLERSLIWVEEVQRLTPSLPLKIDLILREHYGLQQKDKKTQKAQ